MSALDLAQRYFEGWNRRDAAAVLAILAADGTYSDPTTGGPLSGDAFAGYMNGLFSAFPDASFDIVSVGLAAPDLVAAQWIMRGTNHGSMFDLPPTGRPVVLPGADFIRVAGDTIRSVEGYFDSRVIPDQIGLQVIVQPTAVGPFTFGTATRAWAGNTARPGAFSITALQSRGADDEKGVEEQSRQIATEMLSMQGFIGLVGANVGDRMLTITAWEDATGPSQLRRGGQHGEAMKKFFGTELGGGGFTAVFVPERINAMWVRCTSCQKKNDHATRQGVCACGATLPPVMPYW
jgi:steroid delta-isomerase-like uncharacterized protein